MKHYEKWTPEEVEFLIEEAGSIPLLVLHQKMTEWALSKDREPRTLSSIQRKATRLKISLRARYETMTLWCLAKTLSLTPVVVYKWHRKGWLKTHRYSQKRYGTLYVTLEYFHAFAKRNKDKLRRVDKDILMGLLQDEKLVEEIKSREPRIRLYNVKDLETNIVYPSKTQAAKAFHYSSPQAKFIVDNPRFQLIPVTI